MSERFEVRWDHCPCEYIWVVVVFLASLHSLPWTHLPHAAALRRRLSRNALPRHPEQEGVAAPRMRLSGAREKRERDRNVAC